MRSLIRGFRPKAGRTGHCDGDVARPGPALHGPVSRERGASVVIFALLVPALFAAGALALDIGKLVAERQHLSNALDAGALAGAVSLPGDPAAAKTAALAYAKSNDPEALPAVTFWCVVASTGTAKLPDVTQFATVCNPGTVLGAKCDLKICAIPCTPGLGKTCNTITLTDDKPVPFDLAPVIGVDTGNTGALAANACQGSCGAQIPNPMDIVFVADRTGSMSTSNRIAMANAIESTLQSMTKEQQYVALGTIHKSAPTPACLTAPAPTFTGTWVPVPFSNDYSKPSAIPGAKPDLNTSSTLYKSLECLKATSSSGGTYLASPMKSAARYLLGMDPNNLGSLPARTFPAKKAIIFETDGQPNETNITPKGDTDLDKPGDLGDADGWKACENLLKVAKNAKNAGILIVTVAFGPANTAECKSGRPVRDVLAEAASKDANDKDSDADNDCGNAAKRAIENSDGDYFFCASNGSELGPIFSSAVNAVTKNSILLRIPE